MEGRVFFLCSVFSSLLTRDASVGRNSGEELEKGLDAPSGFLFPSRLRLAADSCAVQVRSSWQRKEGRAPGRSQRRRKRSF